MRISQRILQAHLKAAQATAQTKVFNRVCKANLKKIVFKKFPTLEKK
jgi:hypothetical protein